MSEPTGSVPVWLHRHWIHRTDLLSTYLFSQHWSNGCCSGLSGKSLPEQWHMPEWKVSVFECLHWASLWCPYPPLPEEAVQREWHMPGWFFDSELLDMHTSTWLYWASLLSNIFMWTKSMCYSSSTCSVNQQSNLVECTCTGSYRGSKCDVARSYILSYLPANASEVYEVMMALN